MSVRLWQVTVLLKWLNVRSCKQYDTIAQILCFFWCGISQNSNRVTPLEVLICRWSRLNVGAVAANWQLSTWSVVNLALSQVYNTSRPPAHWRWCFVSDSWYLFLCHLFVNMSSVTGTWHILCSPFDTVTLLKCITAIFICLNSRCFLWGLWAGQGRRSSAFYRPYAVIDGRWPT